MAKQVVDDSKFAGLRLPTNIKPVHYDLTLKPNFKDFTFTGQVKIDYVSTNAGDLSNSIVLHANNIQIQDGSVHGKNPLTTVTYGKSTETATLEFQEDVAPSGTLDLNFTGVLNDKLKGFYRTTYKVDGETVYAASTQFESTDARQCFPCWDEPAVKATFTVSMIIEKFMTVNGKQYERLALSNMPEVSRTGSDSETVVKFDKSPIMSTYLLAFVVGPFDVIEVMNKQRPIRVYTTPGKKELGRFALDAATKSLSFYEDYFGIDYPLPKMDLIAVPDFASGAMENWGLITYRETCVLVDPENTSTRRKQWVALVVAHEIAHQWFGNLVTMEWWTHLWLNEGFASFMEYLCVANIFPEFSIWEDFVTGQYGSSVELDALHNSHPIEVPVNHPREIEEIFDDISYAKGATVIRMLYEYIGDDKFRKGMKEYLTKFAYKNAFTEDLWDSLERASDKPVRAMMSGWTSQMGYPWLAIEHTVEGDSIKLKLTQSKFSADGKLPGDEAKSQWMVPISAITGKNPSKVQEVCLLSEKSAEVKIDGVGDSWLKLNPGSIGMYRTVYPQEMISKLYPAITDKSLPAIDRLNLQNDVYALCQAGKASTVDLLKLLQSFKNEDVQTVWKSIDASVGKLKVILNQSEVKQKYLAYVRQLYSDIYKTVGWDAKPGESHMDALSRDLILSRLVGSGDEAVIAEALKRFKQHMDKTATLAPDVRAAVYRAVATYGDDEAFDGLFHIYRTTDLSEEKNRSAMGLASTHNQARLQKVINFAMSDEVKGQDRVLVLMPIGPNYPDILFKILKDNKDFFLEKYEGTHLMTTFIKSAISYFTKEADAVEVDKFFEQNKFPGCERTIQQGLETIRLNANWLARDGDAIKDFLSSY